MNNESNIIWQTINKAGHRYDGINVPFIRYQMNEGQELIVVGIPKDAEDMEVMPVETQLSKPTILGRFSEQGAIFQAQIENSLQRDKWPFDKYPDPLIVVVESYVMYGPEWEAQLMKWKKRDLIDFARKALIEVQVYKNKLDVMSQT